MKIWNAFGSEHSANIVIIGRFKDTATAEATDVAIEELKHIMRNSENTADKKRYTPEVTAVLKKIKVNYIAAEELGQFSFDFNAELKGSTIEVTTEEVDVSALIKLFIEQGARVAVFSRHDYPEGDSNKGSN